MIWGTQLTQSFYLYINGNIFNQWCRCLFCLQIYFQYNARKSLFIFFLSWSLCALLINWSFNWIFLNVRCWLLFQVILVSFIFRLTNFDRVFWFNLKFFIRTVKLCRYPHIDHVVLTNFKDWVDIHLSTPGLIIRLEYKQLPIFLKKTWTPFFWSWPLGSLPWSYCSSYGQNMMFIILEFITL